MAHLCIPLCTLLQQPSKPAYLNCQGRSAGSHEFVQRVASLSAALTARFALQSGSVVMLASQNTDHMLEALLAVWDAGCIATPVNHRWSSAELASAISLTAPACILADEHCSGLVQAALASAPDKHAPVLVKLGAPAAQPSSLEAPAFPYHADTLIHEQLPKRPPLQLRAPVSGAALIVFTSGTTGSSKGVLISHTAIHTQSLAKLAVVGYASDDVYLHTAPLFHIGGISSAHACLMAGASHVITPRFTAQGAIDDIRRHKVTSFIAVPVMIQDLASHVCTEADRGTGLAITSVRTILLGAGSTSEAVKALIRRAFPCARVLSAYGMTEAASSMTFLTLIHPTPNNTPGSAQPSTAAAAQNSVSADLWACAVCAGTPAPGIGLCIMSAPQGEVVHSGGTGSVTALGPMQEGEIWTRGPHTFMQYWGNEVDTAKAYRAGGWMRTGDLGFIAPDGSLWLKGRAKDMIKTGGENVHASEVERALSSHPGVSAAVVVGVPHERWGEAVAACVVLRPGYSWADDLAVDTSAWSQGEHTPVTQSTTAAGSHQALTSAALQSHCRQTVLLSPYKIPRLIAAVTQEGRVVTDPDMTRVLPVNSSGKIVKPVIRDALIRRLLADSSEQMLPRSRL